MKDQIIECIPNFSEGQRPEVIKKITKVIEAVPEIQILDIHSDKDHNRTVITFIGVPAAVEEAAFQAIKKAAELINLDEHHGSHPRLGATDVVPLVPITGITMDECIRIAHQLSERVGKELNIPVYLYEEAALKPERSKLENIRKGEYELLKKEIQSEKSRTPDFGPKLLGPAGATIIGARNPLIAFNVYLDTDNLQIAKDIAKSIRESSGGLTAVKALGMMVDGLAQVSMNLTNFRKTSLFKVFESIQAQAKKHHSRIHHSEIVGLLPQEALIETAKSFLKLDDFNEDQIFENQLLKAKSQKTLPGENLLDEFASSKPAPGGGSAAAYSGAIAAALVCMVARLTIGKKKYAPVENQMEEIILQSEKIRSQLTELVEKDASAFNDVMLAFKLPKDTLELDEIRMGAIEKATQEAALIPMQVAKFSLTVLALAERVISLGNINTISDGGSAGALAMASIKAASYNVRINLANLSDTIFRESLQEQMDQIEQRAATIEKQLLQVINDRGGL